MKIQVDWFKETGKWYTGGLVEINDYHIWEPEFHQAIIDNQQELMDGWQNHGYTVVCRSTPEQDADPTFKGFYHVLIHPRTFAGMRRLRGGQ